jgi:two-component system response regulator DevR
MQGYVPRYQRVFLLDDHDIVRRGLHDLLTRARDIDVVGESGSAQSAAADILRLDADVMLLDLQLEDGSGIEVCRAVRSVKPSARGLLLTAAGDDVAAAAAVLAGATGYLVKVTRSNDIVGAVRNERTGSSHLDAPSIQRAHDLLRSVMESLTPPVTEHERQVLAHVLDGRTDSEIAEARATSNGQRGPDIVAFVARMTQALLGRAAPSDEPGTGRHRREQSG